MISEVFRCGTFRERFGASVAHETQGREMGVGGIGNGSVAGQKRSRLRRKVGIEGKRGGQQPGG